MRPHTVPGREIKFITFEPGVPNVMTQDVLRGIEHAAANYFHYRSVLLDAAAEAAYVYKPKGWWSSFLWDQVDKRVRAEVTDHAHKRMPAGLFVDMKFKNLRDELNHRLLPDTLKVFKSIPHREGMVAHNIPVALTAEQIKTVNDWINPEFVDSFLATAKIRPQYFNS